MPNWLTTPLIPQTSWRGFQNRLDPAPTSETDVHPVRSFAVGALDALRDLSSPVGLGSLALGGGGGMALRGLSRAAPRAAQALSSLTPDLVEAPSIRQVMPQMDEVNALIGDMRRNLARVPPRATPHAPAAPRPRPALETLGEQNPFFTPRGGEWLYNAGRSR